MDILTDSMPTHTPALEIAARFVLAAVLGAIIGLDRELTDRPAGLRTHMLTALAAAVFTVITLELFYQVHNMEQRVTADPIRIIEAVTAGVAFLAAGVIIRGEDTVQGLTTGAGMWLAGSIGVACGGGFYTVAAMAMVPAVVILSVLGLVKRRFFETGEDGKSGGP